MKNAFDYRMEIRMSSDMGGIGFCPDNLVIVTVRTSFGPSSTR